METATEFPAATNARNNIPFWMAVLPIAVLIALLAINVKLYGNESSYGANQIALLLAAATAAAIGVLLRVPIKTMVDGIRHSIDSSVVAILILLLIGSLTGTWMISGIVPAMIYYGLDVLSPEIFLFAAAIVCALVSVATGSSWSTVATVGIALLGIGNALGIYEGWTAGAIISGAYFGDKISPLSDTTNLASAMAGTDLITHIRYMLWTTIPSFLIAIAVFLVVGFVNEPQEVVINQSALKQEIANRFNLNPIIFVVPLAVLVMVFIKVDALVALFFGAVAGGIVAILLQPVAVTTVAGLADVPVTVVDADGIERSEMRQPSYLKRSYVAFINSMSGETRLIDSDRSKLLEAQAKELQQKIDEDSNDTAQAEQNRAVLSSQLQQIEAEFSASKLLVGKGMFGMLNTVWLIITAMCFGGVMEACGLLRRITEPLVAMAQSTGALVSTTAASCVFVNLTASDQYLSIVVPGRMFRGTYRQRGLAPQNLSRTLEDAGTVTSVLIPWNTCGSAQQSVLGVSAETYALYCLFNIISPLMTLLFAWLGIRIAKLPDDKHVE